MDAKVISFFDDIKELQCSQTAWKDDFNNNDNYCESTSGGDSSDNGDGEFLEQILDGVYSSPYLPSNPLDPVERESLLIFDKDFFKKKSCTWKRITGWWSPYYK